MEVHGTWGWKSQVDEAQYPAFFFEGSFAMQNWICEVSSGSELNLWSLESSSIA